MTENKSDDVAPLLRDKNEFEQADFVEVILDAARGKRFKINLHEARVLMSFVGLVRGEQAVGIDLFRDVNRAVLRYEEHLLRLARESRL